MDKIKFKDFSLSDDITNALNSLGYKEPTEVQEKVIPLALKKKDIVVKSQTGSGKTAAYAIPICELVQWSDNKPQALVLTPTRELALQVKEDFINIGRLKRIKATAVYGRQQVAIQKMELKQKTHVVVGTPGRIIDLIEKGVLVLSQISYLVIDEADEMLRMGFIEQVEEIMKHLPQNRVTMLFSATLPESVKNLAGKYMNDPVDIEIMATKETALKIEHSVYKVDEIGKLALLLDLTVIENPDSCIIFCHTKEQVDLVYRKLIDMKYNCSKIHGGMEQKDRLSSMKGFKRGEFRYLIATDVAARGIDVENISLMINYDIPQNKESYIHRTGRTARAGKEGKAITFATPAEDRYLKEIESHIGFEIPIKVAPTTEEVESKKAEFILKMRSIPQLKKPKSEELDKQIMKLRFHGGKKNKLRATTFVGLISNINGVTAEDIGIITVQDTMTYVEILNGKGSLVLEKVSKSMIKGKPVKVKVVENH